MRRFTATALALASTCLLGAAPSAAAAELVVIVNAANPNTALTAQQAKSYFLKRNAAWQNGERVRPVAGEGDSPDGKAILTQVLGLSSTSSSATGSSGSTRTPTSRPRACRTKPRC